MFAKIFYATEATDVIMSSKRKVWRPLRSIVEKKMAEGDSNSSIRSWLKDDWGISVTPRTLQRIREDVLDR